MMRPGKQIKSVSTMLARRMQAAARSRQLDDMTGIISWIIAFLSENTDKPVYQKDIEREFGLSRSAVSRALGQMEEKELVIRTASSDDSRLKELALTPKAKAVSCQLHSICRSVEDELVKGFSPQETAELCGYLERIENNLRSLPLLNETFSEKD